MAQILKYKDLSDAKEIIKIPSGSKLNEFITGVNWENFVIYANGIQVTSDYVIHENDLVIIRSIPHLTGIAIALGVIAIASAVYGGIIAYKAKKEAEQAEKELEKLRNQTSDGVTNIPYLKGASNSVATSKTQPYIIGKHLLTPYILNAGGNNYKGFHKISGTNGVEQYYNVVLECGFNKQILESISCDDVKVADLKQTTPQEGIFNFAANSVFANDKSFIEIAQDGNEFDTSDFNTKIVENEVSDEIGHADDDNYEPLYYTLEDNVKAADVCIMFNGLYYTSSSGTRGIMKRHIIPQYSLDYAELVATGGDVAKATWTNFTFDQPNYPDGETSYTYNGVYEVSTKSFKNSVVDKALNTPSMWTFKSGTDVRNYEGFTYSSKKTTKGTALPMRFRINASYTAKTKGEITHLYNNEFSYNKNQQLRFNAHVDFSYTDRFHLDSDTNAYVKNLYPITVRVYTTDNAVTEGSAVDTCYVEWVQSSCFNEKASIAAESFVDEKIINSREAALSTLLGIHIKATAANEDKLGKINIVTNGLARTWDGTEWSTTKSLTSNVAACVLELLTSSIHPASKLEDSEIDLDAFGAWYTYCDDNYLNVNKVLTQGATKQNVLSDLVSLGRAMLYEDIYGQLSVAFDDIQENATALLNEQNLISFSYEKDLSRQPDGVKITYVDADAGYDENSIIVMYDNSDPEDRGTDATLTEINVSGITSATEAWRYAHYVMNTARLRMRKATAEIGKEGIYFVPYSKILVQHPSLKIGLGSAEIKSVITDEDENIMGLELYDAVELDTSSYFYITVNTPSGVISDVRINGYNGRTTEIEFSDIYSGSITPKAGDIISYGKADLVTEPFIVAGIAPSDTGFTLTLYDYDARIFDFGTIPEYESPLSSTNSGMGGILPTEVPNVYPTIEQVQEIAKANAEAVRVLDSLMDSGTRGEVAMYNGAWFKFDGTAWHLLNQTGYLGTLTALPDKADIDSFFLSLFEGSYDVPLQLYTGNNLKLYDGNDLYITTRTKRGYIYYATESGWHCDNNRNSWRYIIALADLNEYNFDLPSVIPEIIENGTGSYIGALYDNPTSFKNGDWFVWAADTITDFEKGQVYKLIDGTWVKLDQTDTDNSKEFMTCLSDLLKVQSASTGYFSTIFANALIANDAFIDTLTANEAFIEKLSAKYVSTQDITSGSGTFTGLKADSATFTNVKATGELNATSGTFKNVDITGNIKATNGLVCTRHLSKTYSDSGDKYKFLQTDLLTYFSEDTEILCNGILNNKVIFKLKKTGSVITLYNISVDSYQRFSSAELNLNTSTYSGSTTVDLYF